MSRLAALYKLGLDPADLPTLQRNLRKRIALGNRQLMESFK